MAAAFECLRLANVFGMPSETTIQALLMINLTIANDANPSMAWSLLGTTAQNAQSIGLHVNIHTSPEWDAAIHPLWSAIWFLESSLSLAFGRRPCSFVAGCDRQNLYILPDMTFPTFCSWTGAIHKLKLNWQLEEAGDMRGGHVPLSTMTKYLESLANLEDMPPYGTRSNTRPSTIHRRIEQLVSLIHINHLKAEILRVGALSARIDRAIRIDCLDKMMQSMSGLISAYCALKPLSATMANSWPILYATISAALLLSGISRRTNADTSHLIRNLIRLLSDGDDVDGSDDSFMKIGCKAYADSLKVLRHLSEN